jgi:hypothetical protein
MPIRTGLAAVLLLVAPAAMYAQPPSNAPAYQLMGRVVMDDGSTVPLTTQIEFICNGQGRKRFRILTNGDFNFTVGADTTEVPDLAMPRDAFGGQRIPFDPRSNTPSSVDSGRFELAGCELRGFLPGAQSSVILLEPRVFEDARGVAF